MVLQDEDLYALLYDLESIVGYYNRIAMDFREGAVAWHEHRGASYWLYRDARARIHRGEGFNLTGGDHGIRDL